MSDVLVYEKNEHVVTITLNRPERHNALNWELYQAATDAFDQANADATVRCIIFTGAGRSFCSGDDIIDIMASGDGLEGVVSEKTDSPKTGTNPPLAVAMKNSRCPIIVAVNGAAIGFGMELTLLADIRIASEKARFSEMFIKRGIIATHISYDLLPGIVGPAMAAEMLLTGDIINAEKAKEIKLVSHVTSHDELLSTAMDIASRIASNPPLAAERAKQALRMKRAHQEDSLDSYLTESLGALAKTNDHKESVSAFLEKRAGVYNGT